MGFVQGLPRVPAQRGQGGDKRPPAPPPTEEEKSRGREGRVNVGCLWNVSNMICIELNYNKTQDKALKSKLE